MIDTIKMMVITPTLTPRMVKDERSLFARSVSKAIRADSLMSSNLIIAKGAGGRKKIFVLPTDSLFFRSPAPDSSSCLLDLTLRVAPQSDRDAPRARPARGR